MKESCVLDVGLRWAPQQPLGSFLACDHAAWITGAVLPVDGGVSPSDCCEAPPGVERLTLEK